MSARRRVCAVVPAAGRGTRVGVDLPKVLMSLAPGISVWSLLRDRLRPHVDHVALVLSPRGLGDFSAQRTVEDAAMLGLCVQDTPLGMGHAVFAAESAWLAFDDILVVWGDQVGLTEATAAATIARQREHEGPAISLPLVQVERPYVQYDFSTPPEGTRAGTLARVRQSREGDVCDAFGLADVGCFALSTVGLGDAWRAYCSTSPHARGAITNELNFLPFLAYLSTTRGWPVHAVAGAAPSERLGINTPEELAFFRARLTQAR